MKEEIKKIVKSPLLIVIVAVVIISIIGTSYALGDNNYLYNSNAVNYNNNESGLQSTNVQGAIDELLTHATDYTSMDERVTALENCTEGIHNPKVIQGGTVGYTTNMELRWMKCGLLVHISGLVWNLDVGTATSEQLKLSIPFAARFISLRNYGQFGYNGTGVVNPYVLVNPQESVPTIVFSNYCKINENGECHSKTIIAPSWVDFKKLLKGNCLGNLTCMYDKEKVGDIRQKKLGHEDYLFWLLILKKGSIALNTNTVEALYRVLDNSVSSNKVKVYKWYWHIFRRELNMSFFFSAYCLSHCGIRAIMKYIR